jgi:Cys-tRNA(Pro) deacylase
MTRELNFCVTKEMKDVKFPVTAAIHSLRKEGVAFTPHLYKYEDKGGTSVSSRELGVPEDIVIKTLIMEDDKKNPMIVLMHGNKQVSTKELARQVGAKAISPCKPEVADRHSGYQVGGTSPFATKKKMPVYAEASIALLDRIFINGGSKGFLIEISPKDLDRLLAPTWVEVAI